MKVLIRNYQGNGYVWKDATWREFTYYVDDEVFGETALNSVEILAVKDDNRNGYVVCRHCNTLVRNDPAEIEKHYAEMEAKKDCTKCKYMRIWGDRRDQTIKYAPNEDGTYTCTDVSNVRLGCTIGWLTVEVNKAEAKRNCHYAQCRRQGVATINDAFVQYPGLFNKSLTIDTLEENKYVNEGYKNGFFEYDMRLRGSLKACVNTNGIVDHFRFISRGWSTNIYYSDTYNKLFYADWDKYNDKIGDVMNDAKEQQILAKISKLYKEAETDE